MAADFNKPVTTDGYADVLGKLRDNDTALAVALDPALVTPANTPTGAVRWTSASSKWQRYNGTSWADITPANNITGNAATATTAAACSGNAATATVLATARTIDGVSFNGSANIEVLAPATHAATSKGTPVDADELPLSDSAASFGLKRLTWGNVKATLKTYFDTLYAKIGLITASGSTMMTGKLLGRGTAATGAVEEITLGTGLSFTGTALNVAYDAAASQVEMEAGTEAALRSMSPLRVAQAIAALGGAGATAQAFTSNGTWNRPTGCIGILIIGWGGGCGGGGANFSVGQFSRGGAGSSANSVFVASPAASYAVTIGAGGAGATSSPGGGHTDIGSAGSDTTVSAVFTAKGAQRAGSASPILLPVGEYSGAGFNGPGGLGGAMVVSSSNGNAGAANSGAGGSGAVDIASINRTGGAGGSGYALIVEFY